MWFMNLPALEHLDFWGFPSVNTYSMRYFFVIGHDVQSFLDSQFV